MFKVEPQAKVWEPQKSRNLTYLFSSVSQAFTHPTKSSQAKREKRAACPCLGTMLFRGKLNFKSNKSDGTLRRDPIITAKAGIFLNVWHIS